VCLPQLFEIPSQYVVCVPITHPTYKSISALGLQWYSVPAVSNMELSVGGITYTAAPFNGEDPGATICDLLL
jgi:nitric-oxide synthase